MGDRRPLRIGIIGAGLVGATAAIALSRLENVVVKAFERSPGPREEGAWISFNVSGLSILDRLIDLDQIQQILYRGDSNGAYVSRHWRTGEILALAHSSRHVAEKFTQARTHRVPVLNVLLSNVPAGTIQYGRSVLGTEVTEDGVRVNFKDSEPETFDLVVAADGIYSKIRQQYLSAKVEFRGAVAYRKIFPESQVSHIRGLPNDTSVWRGNGGFMFLSRLGLGMYGVVAIVPESPEFAATLKWARSVGSEGLQRLRQRFSNWDPIIDQVLQTMTDIDAYPLDSGPWMKELVRDDRIAFVGDAAHPTAGAYGAGSAMGYADCWALFRSLEQSYKRPKPNAPSIVESPVPPHLYDLPRALRLYNETRRHFLGRVELQMALDRNESAYLAEAEDEEEWIRRFKERHSNQIWLTEHDVEAEFQKTLAGEAHWLSQVEAAKGVKAHL